MTKLEPLTLPNETKLKTTPKITEPTIEYSGIYYRIDSASKYYEKGYLKVDYKCVIDNSNILLYISKYRTAEEAQNLWLFLIKNTYQALYLKRSIGDVDGIDVGDIAVGRNNSLCFLRNNIIVQIDGRDNSIAEMAKEIDNQIIDLSN
jgi:hypothetical protein